MDPENLLRAEIPLERKVKKFGGKLYTIKIR